MALQIRRGTDSQRQGITPAEGELIYTTDTDKLYIGDGSTAGGIEVSGGVDSAAISAIISASSIDAAQLDGQNPSYYLDYNNLSNIPATQTDSSTVDSIVLSIVDSNYVQARETAQDFAYSSLTGTPTIPTNNSQLTNGAAYVTQAAVDSAITALIDGAPGALDTLNELAAALGDDAAFESTITNALATKLNLSGGTLTGTLVSQNIEPTTDDTYDLGSTTKRFRDLYLGPGSLYVNNKKVIEDESGTITFKTDSDQNLTIKTQGTGQTTVQSAAGINLTSTGSADIALTTNTGNIEMNGDVIINSTNSINSSNSDPINFGDNLDLNSNKIVNVGTPTAVTDAVNKTYVDNLNVSTFTNDAGYLTSAVDSAGVQGIVDSSYVQSRQTPQNFAYGSLTGAPTNVSDFTNDAGYLTSVDAALDSAEVTAMVDSAYVQARQTTTTSLAFSAITSTPTTLAGYGITDGGGTDSASVSAIITADVDAAFINNLTIDADTLGGQNSAYHLDYNNFTNKPTIPTNNNQLTNGAGYITSFTETNDLSSAVTWANVPDANITESSVTQHQAALSITQSQISDLSAGTDSAAVTAMIDSNYVQARQANASPGATTISTYTFTATAGQTVFSVNYPVGKLNVYLNGILLDPTDYTATNGTSITLDTGAAVNDLVNVITYTTAAVGTLDSAGVTGLIDSSYIQVRQAVQQDHVSKVVYDNSNPGSSVVLNAGSSAGTATYYGDVIDGSSNVILDVSGGTFTGNVMGEVHGDVRTADGSTIIVDVDNGTGTAVFTGNVTGTVSSISNHLTAIESMIDSNVNAVIDGAPGALDTLNELAAALGDDANFATTITSQIAALPDSSEVSAIITADVDAAYVQARQGGNVSTFTNDAGYLTAATVGGLDSALTSDIIADDVDKAFVDALNVDADTLDGQDGTYYLNYNNFSNTPTIPTNNNQLTNGAGYITSVPAQSFTSLTGKPTTIAGYGITDAFDGVFASLTSKPTTLAGYGITDGGGTDSASVISLIDSSYVQARQAAVTGGATTVNTTSFTATAGQTTFSVNYTVGKLNVYLNGILLDAADFTATNGTSIVLATGADVGDILHVITYDTVAASTIDSAGISSIITADVDASFVNALGISAGVDSAGISSIITADVDATFINNLTIDADTLGGQNSAYHLDYTNFTNTPTIPTNNNQLTNGAGYLTSVPAQSFASLTGKPTTIAGYGITDAFDGAYSSLTGAPNLLDSATVLSLSLDSAEVANLIDSSYVQARQTTISLTGGDGIDVVQGYSLTGSTNDSVSYQTKASIRNIQFKPDGTKLFVFSTWNDNTGRKWEEHDLSTPWDISTASNANSDFYVGNQSTSVNGSYLTDNGLYFYVVDNSYNVYQYTLSTAWDVSTASHTRTQSFYDADSPAWETLMKAVRLNNNGTKIILLNNTGAKFGTFDLSTPYNISSRSSDAVDVTTWPTSGIVGFKFTESGTKVYTSHSSGYVYKWSLSTAYDMSTVGSTADESYNTGLSSTFYDTTIEETGGKLYVIHGNNPAYVKAFSLGGGSGNTISVTDSYITNLIDSSYVQVRQSTTDLTNYRTSTQIESMIDSNVNAIVDAAPGALDTLNELAAALGDDANFSTTITNQIAGKLDSAQAIATITGSDLDMGGNKVLFGNVYSAEGDLPNASSYHGMFAHVHATGAGYFAHGGNWIKLANNSDIPSVIDSAGISSIITADVDAAFVNGLGISSGTDSASIIAMIDSSYVQARQLGTDPGVSRLSRSVFTFTATANQTVFTGTATSGGTLAFNTEVDVYINGILLDATDYALSGGNTLTLTSGTGVNNIVTIVDYGATAISLLDSAAITDIVDSAYVTARAGAGTDSATVSAIITADVDATFINNLTIDADTLGGQNSAYHLDYTNFTNTPTIPTNNNQLTNGAGYLTSFTETNDLSSAVTWANIPDANVPQSAVTQHQAALTITESQISDLAHTTSLAFSAITSTPTTLAGYGITDGGGTDSAAVVSMIDSAYVQNRQSTVSAGATTIDTSTFTATAGQTVFTVNYTVGKLNVYLNGILLDPSDYTATNGTSITLDTGAAVNDLVNVITYTTAAVGNLDSAGVTGIVNSAYIQARQGGNVSQFTNDAGYLTSAIDSAYVTTQIDSLIDAAPGALNTLNELAAAIGDDANFSTTITNQIAALPDSSQVSGIITADVDKAFVDALGINATQLNSQAASYYLDYNNFSNTPTIPTNNNQLTNGAGYLTSVPAQSFASLTGKPTTLAGYGITDGGGTDSASVSAIITADVDAAFVNGLGISAGLDSAEILALTAGVIPNVTTYSYTATAGQQTFSGSGLSYEVNKLQVHLNGIMLVNGTDYTATNGTTVVLTGTANVNDILAVTAFTSGMVGTLDSAGTNALISSKLSAMDQHVIPTADNTYDLGSTTKRFRDLYLGPGSLYVNNKKVIEDDAGTITIKTDADQNMVVKTTGTGQTTMTSAAGINLTASSTADVTLTAAGGQIELNGDITINAANSINSSNANPINFGDAIDMNSNKIVNVTDPTANQDAATKAYVDTQVAGASGSIDSAGTIALIDSSYVQARQDLAYGSLTGTPTIPTNNNQLTNGAGYLVSSDLSTYATQTYVTNAVNDVIDAAPGALDTLNELAAALGDDANFSTTVTNQIAGKLDSAQAIATITGSDLDMGGNKVLFGNVYTAQSDLPSASSYHGMFAHVHNDGAGYFAHAGNWVRLANQSEIPSVIDSAGISSIITADVDATFINGLGIAGYADADVDTHLNQSSASSNEVLSWNGSDYAWVAQSSGGTDSATVSSIITADVDAAFVTNLGFTAGASGTTSDGIDTTYVYTATANQTAFTGSDDNSATLSYATNSIMVYLNGILLIPTTDYTATNGTTVTLTTAAEANDEILIVTVKSGPKTWTEESGNYTATAGDKLFIDVSGGTATVTMPASPTMGDEVRVIDATGNAATNNITINRNGNNINGAADNLVLDVNRAAIGLAYYNSTQGWVLIER